MVNIFEIFEKTLKLMTAVGAAASNLGARCARQIVHFTA
jgi:hypothetical protein